MEGESTSVSSESLIEIRPEELVTFQVVVIGSNGLVVGSDRAQVYVTPDPQEVRARSAVQKNQVFKFVEKDGGQIICAFAGGPAARGMAQQVVSNCNLTSSESAWELT